MIRMLLTGIFCVSSLAWGQEALLTAHFVGGNQVPPYAAMETRCDIHADGVVRTRNIAGIVSTETSGVRFDAQGAAKIQELIGQAAQGPIATPRQATAGAPTLTLTAQGNVMLRQIQGENEVRVNQSEAATTLTLLLETHCQ